MQAASQNVDNVWRISLTPQQIGQKSAGKTASLLRHRRFSSSFSLLFIHILRADIESAASCRKITAALRERVRDQHPTSAF
jgi:hypothetical protein